MFQSKDSSLKSNAILKLKENELLIHDLSITTEKKNIVRKDINETFDNQNHRVINMTKSIDTEQWKQQVRKMKNSCSQTILHIENRDLNLNNTLISQSERNIYQLCKNNDGKKAKYRLANSKEQGQFCLKCSIKLLQQGIQIVEISEQNSSKKHIQINVRPFVKQLETNSRMLETNWKALQKNYFFIEIDDQRSKILNAYDSIIRLIENMRDEDINKLDSIKLNIMKQSQAQIITLKNTNKKIQILIKQLYDIDTFEEQKKRRIIQLSKSISSNLSQYEPLQFSMKKEDIDTIKQKIFTRVSKEFTAKQYPIHFSFNQKSQLLQSNEQNSQIFMRRKQSQNSSTSYQKGNGIAQKNILPYLI